MALEEREKWRKREKEILKEIKKVEKRKKKLQEKAKELKENIKQIEDAIRAVKRGEVDKAGITERFDEHIIR